MKVELSPGEKIAVTFAGTDGTIEVAFGATYFRVTADLPDSSGREGVIYEEKADPLGLAALKNDMPVVAGTGLLTQEQVEARNESLVRNLRFKWPQVLETYPDNVIVKAYDDWFQQAENVGDGYEWGFMGFLPGFEEGWTYPQWQHQREVQRRNREAEAKQPM